jgi:hypothetical protein
MSETPRVGSQPLVAAVVVSLAVLVGAERIRDAILTNTRTASAGAAQSGVGNLGLGLSNPNTPPPAAPAKSAPTQDAAAQADFKLKLRDEAQALLSQRQPKYAEICGKLKRKDMLEPAFSNYRVTVQFDPNGRELSRRFEGGAPHAARDHCVSRLQDEPLVIDAPGAPISLDLGLPVP